MDRALTAAQLVALVGLGAVVAWQSSRISALESELDTIERPAAPTRQRPQPVPTPRERPVHPEAVVDDHMWSEAGRAAIRDVLDAREAEKAASDAAAWDEWRAFKIRKARLHVAEALDLDPSTEELLGELLEGHFTARDRRWALMKADPSQTESLMGEAEQAENDFRDALEDLLGDDGARAVQDALRAGGKL